MAIYCRNCGGLIPDGVKFCTNCGTPADPIQPKKANSNIGLKILTAILFVTAVGSVVFYFTGRGKTAEEPTVVSEQSQPVPAPQQESSIVEEEIVPQESDTESNTESVIETSEEPQENPFVPSIASGADNLLPKDTALFEAASQADILGDWEGQFQFTVMEGLDKISGAPDNVDEMIQEALTNPSPFAIRFDDDNGWGLNIEFMGGMSFSERDMQIEEPKTLEDQTAHLYKGPEDGIITIHPAMMQDPDSTDGGQMSLDAAVGQDADGILIGGKMVISITMQGDTIQMEGTFTVRPEQE